MGAQWRLLLPHCRKPSAGMHFHPAVISQQHCPGVALLYNPDVGPGPALLSTSCVQTECRLLGYSTAASCCPSQLYISPCMLLGLPKPACTLCRAPAQHTALQQHGQLCGLGAQIALCGQPSSVMLPAVCCCSRCAEWLLQQAKKKKKANPPNMSQKASL